MAGMGADCAARRAGSASRQTRTRGRKGMRTPETGRVRPSLALMPYVPVRFCERPLTWRAYRNRDEKTSSHKEHKREWIETLPFVFFVANLPLVFSSSGCGYFFATFATPRSRSVI